MGIFEALVHLELLQQSTAVERFDGRRGKSAQAEGKLLQRRMRGSGLFQYQDRTSGQGQLTCEKQPHRAGPGNDDVVGHLICAVIHEGSIRSVGMRSAFGGIYGTSFHYLGTTFHLCQDMAWPKRRTEVSDGKNRSRESALLKRPSSSWTTLERPASPSVR